MKKFRYKILFLLLFISLLLSNTAFSFFTIELEKENGMTLLTANGGREVGGEKLADNEKPQERTENTFLDTERIIEDSTEHIKENTEHIEGNTEHIEGNTEHIEGNTEHIEGNTEHIEGNTEHIEGNTEHIEGNTEHHIEGNTELIEGSTEPKEESTENTEKNEETLTSNENQHIESDKKGKESTDNHASKSSRSITQLNDSTVIVHSYEELSKALSQNNGYTYIYLAQDIVQGKDQAGINIHSSKSSVVIDGKVPDAAGPVNFFQRNSTDSSNTIRASKDTKSVTLCNMGIAGQNSNGVVYSNYPGLSLIYEKIAYRGPRITLNAGGSAHYKNSSITIKSVTGIEAQEAAQTDSVILSGIIILNSSSSQAPMFKLTGTSPSMIINAGASVTATKSNYFIDANYPAITLESGSRLSFSDSSQGFIKATQSLNSVSIKQGASLSINQTSTNYSNAILRINSSLQMESGTTLMINRVSDGAAIQLVSADASASFNSPQRVMIYSPSGNLIDFENSGSLNITADAVNIWTKSPGYDDPGILNVPTHIWNKAEGKSLIIDYLITGTDHEVFSNIETSDPTADLTASTFALKSSQMLVFGSFMLNIDTVYENSNNISGHTEENSEVQIKNKTHSNALIADGFTTSSVFSLPVYGQISTGDILSVTSFSNHLNKVENTTVAEATEGLLQFAYVPDAISFGILPIIEQSEAISPTNSWHIEISDSRSGSRKWNLLASITAPLTGVSSTGTYTLTDGLVFVSENGETTALSSTRQTLIYTGTGDATLSWDSVSGIFLKANSGEIMCNVNYNTMIEWSLQDVP